MKLATARGARLGYKTMSMLPFVVVRRTAVSASESENFSDNGMLKGALMPMVRFEKVLLMLGPLKAGSTRSVRVALAVAPPA